MRRLSKFAMVVVNPPWRGALRSDSFECRVLAVIGNVAAIEPIDLASTLWLPARLEGALLSFCHEGGLVGLAGTLCLRDRVGDMRYVATDAIQSGSRHSTLVNDCAPIALQSSAGQTPVEGYTERIGAYTLDVVCKLDVVPGEELEFSLALPGVEQSVDGTAIVVSAAEGNIALEIDPSNRDVHSRLARFIVGHNRAILRRRHRRDNDVPDF